MKIYKKYLISNLFKPLIISLLTLIAIIWSTRVIRFMDLIVYDGAEFISFFKLTLLILPSLILIILPLSIFLTTILTYNKLIENREIIIFKNCGIKKLQLLSPLLILSVIITLFSFYISLDLSYKSNVGIRLTKEEIKNNLSVNMIKIGSFSKIKNLVIYADKKDDNKIYNVMIFNSAKNKDEKNFLLQARHAEINNNIITLYDGNFQKFSNITEETPEILFFKKYDADMNDLTQETTTILTKSDTISTRELIKVLRNYESYKTIFKNKNALIYELNYRLSFPMVSIIIALLCGSIMLEGSFNRISNSKTLLETSIAGGGSYIMLLSLYQKVENGIIFLYILYFAIMVLILISLYLIREKEVI